MSTYPMQELIRLWRRGKLDDAQLIGQLLAYAHEVLERQAASQAQIATLRENIRMLRISTAKSSTG